MFSWLSRLWSRPGPGPGLILAVADSARAEAVAHKTDPAATQLLAEAQAHIQRADLHSASKCITEALEIDPLAAEAHRIAAAVRLALGDAEAALDHYTLALHFDPDDWGAANGRAELFERSGEAGRAVAAIETFLASHSGHTESLYRLARLQYAAGRHEDALALLRQRLIADSEDIVALNLLGLILAREFGQLGAGEDALKRAVEISPEYWDARSNLGWVYSEQGRLADAMACFDAVLDRDPDDQETRLMRSHAYLRNGKFAEGWRDFEARHASPLAIRHGVLYQRCSSLEEMANRHVLVLSEQGLGDQIMFASCIRDLLAVTASCVLECDLRLLALFQRSFPSVTVSGRVSDAAGLAGELGTIDCQLPIGSLPGLFRREWADFPDHTGYLRADPSRVAYWRNRLAALGNGPAIGISWRGGAVATRRNLRSIPLPMWRVLLEKQARFISLQYGDCMDEVSDLQRQFGLQVHHWPEVLGDYDETAALVSALDSVVSVCTAIVHLGGGLGKRVLVLTPATPEWRYLATGSRLPWYPSVTLLRQGQGEPWGAVIWRAAEALAEAAR